MRALVLTDQGPQLYHNYPIPIPSAGEALIRVQLAGICSTDLQLLAGYKGGYRGVLGHEFVGVVIAAPDAPAWIGRRVVGELNIGCGSCILCRQGLGKHCRQRQSLGIIGRDGAFAEYLTLPLTNLHPVPDSLPDQSAIFVEPTAAALQIREQLAVKPSSRVVILGDGRLGLLVAQVLALTGCNLTVIGRNPEKLALLTGMGFSVTTYLLDELPTEWPDLPIDTVVEATGSPDGFALARRFVRPGGAIVLKSTFANSLPQFDLSGLVVDEITLIGSRCGPFPPAIRLLTGGQVHVQPLIQATYPLPDGVAALAHAARKGVIKVVIAP